MYINESTPAADGYHMPGEFEPHHGCIMIWPDRPGSWPFGAKAAKRAFAEVAAGIAKSEKVYMLAEERLCGEAAEYLRPLVTMVRTSADIEKDETPSVPDREGNPYTASESDKTGDPYTASESDGTGKSHTLAVYDGKAGPFESIVEIVPIPTDDAWARDVCPTFVVKDDRGNDSDIIDDHASGKVANEKDRHANEKRADDKDVGRLRGVSWRFNAWGGDYDGLYAHWEQDDACAGRVCEHLGVLCYDAGDFVLEGGSVHSDGEGTVLVTEACLLSPGRNPRLTKEEIEEKLKIYLGAKKVIWLPHGIYGDETNEHVDNVCAFVRPGEVVLAWPAETDEEKKNSAAGEADGTNDLAAAGETDGTKDLVTAGETDGTNDLAAAGEADGKNDLAATGEAADHDVAWKMQLEYSKSCLNVLESERDAMGRKILVHMLPLPKHPVCIQKEDLPGFSSEEGEAERFEGEQLAASYVNFYIANRSVLVPQFHDENDRVAVEILARLFPEREIVPVYARDILMGGGNIHCITQQIP